VIGFASGQIPSLPINQVLLNNRSLIGIEWGGYAFKHPKENRALIADVLAMAADGRIAPVAPSEVRLEEVPVAFARFLARDVAGKVVAVP
jgi:NADPH2:quinone reductase